MRPSSLNSQEAQNVKDEPGKLGARAAQRGASRSPALRGLHYFDALKSLVQNVPSVQLKTRLD